MLAAPHGDGADAGAGAGADADADGGQGPEKGARDTRSIYLTPYKPYGA